MKSTKWVALALTAGAAVSVVNAGPAKATVSSDQALVTAARADLTPDNQAIFDTLTTAQQLEFGHLMADSANSTDVFDDSLQAQYPDYQITDDTGDDTTPGPNAT
ncbi:hypothetical protein [Flexivirga caeni]|uniref:Uncharacterized protein n=1 Tax=Flexivirga caeni TaxID=2294115 RepID=A0A3M9M6J8_9MICO|nr:hypothetical protein [Flexivirga caeni]RNI20837.1 hypothetical protein EFY87_13060 [Flexivirga caeni]